MFKNTKRVENNGWRFDWVTDLGDVFGGLRFYPETSILSSWSRRPHKAAKENYHPYRINDYSWSHIRQACINRWGGEQEVVVKALEPLIVKEIEVNTDIDTWQGEGWCQKWYKMSVKQYAEKFKRQIRER